MRPMLVNIAILFGFFGFISYILLILAGFFGCCAGLSSKGYFIIAGLIMAVAVILFAICAYNNCCNIKKAEKEKENK
ncbi:MAG: YidC/Oxa1 family membrane protein insertase [Bacteroidetes bacterium]|nr:YidC/Oxa1 family membrane protein insertase [Bacteroidota bacterium]